MPDASRLLDAVGTDELSAAALTRADELGATVADVRIQAVRSQYVGLRDSAVETAADSTEIGVSVRVLAGGAIGFAASVELTTSSVVGLVEAADAGGQLEVAGGGRLQHAGDEHVRAGRFLLREIRSLAAEP